jgi:hypothetical protein
MPTTYPSAQTNMEEGEDERDQQPQPGPDHTGEELGSPQHGHMHTDELPPSQGLRAFRSRWDIMTFEDIADRLVADAGVCSGYV